MQTPSIANSQIKNDSSAGHRGLPAPWLDYGNTTLPENHMQILWWSQYLWYQDGTYRTAMERVCAHFLTDLEFPDLENSEESEWKKLFSNEINYKQELAAVGHEFLAYGNAFVSLYIPFRRFLCCPDCNVETPISQCNYQLDFKPGNQKSSSENDSPLIWKKLGKCANPACSSMTPYEVKDRRDTNLTKVRILRYDPQEIEMAFNRWSGSKEFYWKITEEDRKAIQSKARIHIETTPLEVLEAVAINGQLMFDDDMMLHICETTLSGLRAKGWGLPRSMANFRKAWLLQMVNKADQAVAIDYTLGMRIISPAPTPGGGMDPMQNAGLENFAARMSKIVTEHRSNPASYHTAPYPLNYQFMGGEGAQLVPPDKLKFRQQEYLNDLGVPVEYQQMNMQAQGAPMALRMFETYWQCIPAMYNQVLNWIVQIISKTYDLEPTEVKMQRSTIADDAMYKQVVMQLMSANQLSPQTALQPFGIDATKEVKKVLKHQENVQRIQAEYDERAQHQQELGALKGMTAQMTPAAMAQQQQAAQQGAMSAPPAGAPTGGMPGGGMPGAQSQSPQSLMQLSEQAAQIAQSLVSIPEYNRKQELKALRESNKDLHALVMQNMEDIRRQAASQGQQMLLQQGQPPA